MTTAPSLEVPSRSRAMRSPDVRTGEERGGNTVTGISNEGSPDSSGRPSVPRIPRTSSPPSNASREYPFLLSKSAERSSSPSLGGQLSPHSARRLSNSSSRRSLDLTNARRTDSPERRSSFTTPSTLRTDGLTLERRRSSPLRTDSMNPGASTMCLYEFRRCKQKFRWDTPETTHKVFPDTEPWPPFEKVGIELGRNRTETTFIYACKVEEDKNGLSDTVAVKMVYRGKNNKNNAHLYKAAKTEIENMKMACHNHVIAFLGSFENGAYLGMVLFPVALCDLQYFLRSPNTKLRTEVILPWFSCLARTIEFLHRLHLKHRDIKPANILIDSSGSVFLIDFGISKTYSNAEKMLTSGDNRFTIEYAAPQLIKNKNQGVESDIFSLGCVFLEMATMIIEKTLFEMRQSLSLKGTSDVFYHARADDGAVTYWVGTLLKSVRNNKDAKSYERDLAEFCLPAILSMIIDSADGKKLSLSELCQAFDKLSPAKCNSCCSPAPQCEIPASSQTPPTDTNAADIVSLASPAGSIKKKRVSMSDALSVEMEIIPEHEPGSGSDKGIDTTEQSNIIPGVDVKDFDAMNELSDQKEITPKPKPEKQTLESATESMSRSVSQPITREKVSPTNTSSRQTSTSDQIKQKQSSPAINQPNKDRENKTPLLSNRPESQTRSIQKLTTVNTSIRLASRGRRRPQIKDVSSVDDVPGTEILCFDKTRRKYVSLPKSDFNWDPLKTSESKPGGQRLREGVLLALPRRPALKFRTPNSEINLLRTLSFSKNCKRMCGRSMRTMFIPGRYTEAELSSRMTDVYVK